MYGLQQSKLRKYSVLIQTQKIHNEKMPGKDKSMNILALRRFARLDGGGKYPSGKT